jgi:hypothetical protein
MSSAGGVSVMLKDPTPEQLIAHINESIVLAIQGKSLLTERELSIKGFSPPTQRHLWNNLMRELGFYVEAGLYGGGSFFSALKGNSHLTAIGIEDFSQNFGDPSIGAHLRENIAHYKDEGFFNKVEECDFFASDLSFISGGDLADVDAFYYDAVHDEESQAKALPHFFDKLTDTFLFLVDDADWPQVARGTARAIESVSGKAKVIKQWHLTGGVPDHYQFHNGILLTLMQKI